jgi:hypothetical protein
VALGPPCSVSGFRLRARLGFSIPSSLPGQREVFSRFRIRRSSSERQRDFNPPDQRAAQRTLLSCRTLSFPTTCRFIPAHGHVRPSRFPVSGFNFNAHWLTT